VAAYEVARQLRAQGQEVSLLVLFDGFNPAASQDLTRLERLKEHISTIAARVQFHGSNLARGGVGNILPYLQDRWKWLRQLSWIRIWSVSYRAHQRLGRQLPRWMQNPGDILIHCFYLEWLVAENITHVVMESTGSYWIPIFNILEDHFVVVLANPEEVKNRQGHKTDHKDTERCALRVWSLLIWAVKNSSTRFAAFCVGMKAARAVASQRGKQQARFHYS
jgi:thioesterase domain-containing protein